MSKKTKRNKEALAFLSLFLFAACFKPPKADEGPSSTDYSCLEFPSQACKSWRCSGVGIDLTREPELSASTTTRHNRKIRGTHLNIDGIETEFSVEQLADGTWNASYYLSKGECELVVKLVDGERATLHWNGVEIDGLGQITTAERDALRSLEASPLIGALVGVPLRLGCQPDLQPAAVATLLFPFQVILKYDERGATRTDALIELGSTEKECGYFEGRTDLLSGILIGGEKRLGSVSFARSELIPNVFGFFPLDSSGASDSPGQPLEGDLTGPCSARCRGACGPDCPSTCTRTTRTECSSNGVDQKVEAYDCGVHDGCVEHDNCYDACYGVFPCGSWGAATCRRKCDVQALSKYGFEKTSSWKEGGGPFMRRVTFEYRTPAPGACTCVARATEVALASGQRTTIERLDVGATVAGWDEKNRRVSTGRVEKVLVHPRGETKLDLIRTGGGEVLRLTANHPVLTARGFIAAEQLAVGDTVLVLDKASRKTRREKIVEIVRRESSTDVTYNLKTTLGNYFANDILIHNKCLSAESPIETARGRVPISSLVPGDLVGARRSRSSGWSRVISVYRKQTVLPSIPGRELGALAKVTDNHFLLDQERPAGSSGLRSTPVSGAVFDIETESGNYYVESFLLEGAEANTRCEP